MKPIRSAIAAGSVVLLLIGGCQILSTGTGNEEPIVVGTANGLTGLDPVAVYDSGSWAVFSNIYQGLLTFEHGSTAPTPDAAESCAFANDALTQYQCRLRDDLKFSNGNPLTATAVKNSFERILRIQAPLGPGPLFANLVSVEARDSLVTFYLESADATWPSKIATGAGSIVDPAEFPAHSLRGARTASGSGPYVVSSYEEGKTITLEPNAAYRGAVTRTGPPVEVRFYKTSHEVEKAWNARTIDVAYAGLPAATLAEIGPNDSDVRLAVGDSAVGHYLVLNMRSSRKPFRDVAARRAVAALVDRGRLASEVFEHTVTPLYSLVPQGVTGHNTAFFDEYPEADPRYATQRLRAAGITTPVRIKLGHQSGTAAVEARELQRQLEQNGLFQVELAEEPDFATYQQRSQRGEFDAFLSQWAPDFLDADTFLHPLVGTGNVNRNGYTSAEVDRSIKDTQQYTDRASSMELVREIQNTIAKDVPLVPLWQRKSHVATRPTVIGGHHLADINGVWRLWELGTI